MQLLIHFRLAMTRIASCDMKIKKSKILAQHHKQSEVNLSNEWAIEDMIRICDLLQEKGPSTFAFPTAFRCFQLSLTAFQKFDTKISY